jgi:hypothetical protein
MKEKSKNIVPGEGLGRIQFGMTREVVRQLAGEPDEIEEYRHNDDDDSAAEAWHYDDPEVSFAFEEFNNWKLTSIAISSDDYLLNGKSLTGMSLKDAASFLQKQNIGEVIQEDYSDDESPNLTLLSVDEAGLNLWFDNDRLSEVQVSQVWEDED